MLLSRHWRVLGLRAALTPGAGRWTDRHGPLIEAARAEGPWKLVSRIFPENRASLSLMARMGFSEIGTHQKHGKLDGVWKDCVIVERLILENID
jgi:hypothetical protein